jgi:hypothetical protein
VNERIRFDRTTFDSKGRNGYVGTTGINVVDLGEELFLEPITTRGINSEACRIVLPKSAISTLTEALEEFAPVHATACPGPGPGSRALTTCQRPLAALQPRRIESAIRITTGATNASLHHRTAVSVAGVSAFGC